MSFTRRDVVLTRHGGSGSCDRAFLLCAGGSRFQVFARTTSTRSIAERFRVRFGNRRACHHEVLRRLLNVGPLALEEASSECTQPRGGVPHYPLLCLELPVRHPDGAQTALFACLFRFS